MVTSNTPWALTVAGVDLTADIGGNTYTIPNGNRSSSFDVTTGAGLLTTGAPSGYTPFGTSPLDGTSTVLASDGGEVDFTMNFMLTVPANAAPGDYTGGLTFVFGY